MFTNQAKFCQVFRVMTNWLLLNKRNILGNLFYDSYFTETVIVCNRITNQLNYFYMLYYLTDSKLVVSSVAQF